MILLMVTSILRRARPNSNSGSSHLLGWLGNDTQAASVLATAQLHIKIRTAVSAALPLAMRGAFEVIKIESNILTLTVSSAAFASKFRQLAPRVTAHIQSLGWNMTEIKLRVQGGMGLPVVAKPPREARTLDKQDLMAFENLNRQLRPGPLADAVARLLKHHQIPTERVRLASIHYEKPEVPRTEMNK